MDKQNLAETLRNRFESKIDTIVIKDEVTIEVPAQYLLEICKALHQEEIFLFEELMDVCGVDYSDYGYSYWRTEETTTDGFSRGRTPPEEKERIVAWNKPRFAVVYHLLSLTHNHRLRIRVFALPEFEPTVPSIMNIWNSANWYEREAFDLFGIMFEGHPDLRRLLTDYGFIGHPFRKDFPLIGELEIRYDALKKRCVYEPVSIQPRTLVPKVIREDNRYTHFPGEEGNPDV